LNPVAKAVFGIANVTHAVRAPYLACQQRRVTFDRIALERTKKVRPGSLRSSGPIGGHFAFRGGTAEEIVCNETDLQEKIIPTMFEVMYRVARASCDYVKYGWSSPDDFPRC
jgi:hypothetical protein